VLQLISLTGMTGPDSFGTVSHRSCNQQSHNHIFSPRPLLPGQPFCDPEPFRQTLGRDALAFSYMGHKYSNTRLSLGHSPLSLKHVYAGRNVLLVHFIEADSKAFCFNKNLRMKTSQCQPRHMQLVFNGFIVRRRRVRTLACRSWRARTVRRNILPATSDLDDIDLQNPVTASTNSMKSMEICHHTILALAKIVPSDDGPDNQIRENIIYEPSCHPRTQDSPRSQISH
jgi:hypothetical protein